MTNIVPVSSVRLSVPFLFAISVPFRYEEVFSFLIRYFLPFKWLPWFISPAARRRRPQHFYSFTFPPPLGNLKRHTSWFLLHIFLSFPFIIIILGLHHIHNTWSPFHIVLKRFWFDAKFIWRTYRLTEVNMYSAIIYKYVVHFKISLFAWLLIFKLHKCILQRVSSFCVSDHFTILHLQNT